MAGNPAIGDVHYNQMLQNFSVSWVSDASKYASGQNAFPTVRVEHKSDAYWKFNKADQLRAAMRPRAAGGEAAEAGFGIDPNAEYTCKNWALRVAIPDDKRDNQDPAVDLDKRAAVYLSDQMLRTQEADFLSRYFKSGVWGQDLAVGTTWDQAGSTPIKKLRAAIIQAESQSGFQVETIIISKRVWGILQDNADFISRVNFGTPAPNGSNPNPSIVTPQLLAQVLELRKVIVASAVTCTSQAGTTDVFDFMSGKDCLLIYAPENAEMDGPTSGAKFVWTGRTGAGSDGQIFRSYRDEKRKSDIVEIECAWSFNMVCPELGIYVPGAIA